MPIKNTYQKKKIWTYMYKDCRNMSCITTKTFSRFPTRSDTNQGITKQMICVFFFFTYAKSSFSHDIAHLFIRMIENTSTSFKMETTELVSHVVRKPVFCICENKDADQLRGNREADQRLCFRYTDSTIPLLPKSEISSL